MRPRILAGISLLLAITFSTRARAQEAARQQLDTLNSGSAGQSAEEQTEKQTAEPGAELGPIVVLKRAPQYQPFRVYSDSQYLYNSNILLTPSRPVADGVFAESLGASFSPRLVPGLASSIFVRQQFIQYDTLSRFDFAAQTAGLSLQHAVRNWFIVSGGFEADRYFSWHKDGEFLNDFNTSFGIRSGHYLTRRVFLYYGYQFNWLPSTPSFLSSIDNAVFVGANVALEEKLTLQLAYRLRGLSYYQDAHFDYDDFLNASLVYKFNDYFTARAFVSYANNTSDKPGFNYRGLTTGGGLGLALRF